MSKNSEETIRIIKTGKLPPINNSKTKESNGKTISQRGIGMTTFELNKKNKTE